MLRPDIQQGAHKMMDDWTKILWAALACGSEQRFRIRALACAAVGLTLARDCGLVPQGLDIAAVLDWGMAQVRERMAPASGKPTFEAATDALSRFLHVNVLNTLRVQHAFRPHVQQLVTGQKPQKLVIRHESESKRIYASQKDFRGFVVGAGFAYATVIKELALARILINEKRMLTLGAGTEYASVQVSCVEFDGAHPIFSSLLQEVPNVQTQSGTG